MTTGIGLEGEAAGRHNGSKGGRATTMTEAEWWACDDPRHMLGFLGTRGSDRKLRLFACANARTGSWLIGMSAWCSGDLLARRRDDEPLDAAWAARTILDVRRSPA